ncbi:MAG: alpha/beta fold hydrolase [Gammaproteobacteria bacterium]|nr:alpha/beta fold hydrolase [Gammaproteobacteria bacterium]
MQKLLAPLESQLVGIWPSRVRNAASGRSLDAERGVLLVPSIRTRGESPALSLPFVRVPARRDLGLPPVVVLAGGPGAAAIGAFETSMFEHVERLSEICDVVTFDQRGCQGALPNLDSPHRPQYDLSEVLTRNAALAAQRDHAGRLATYWRERGVEVDAFNTVESAHDVDDLRKALGAETINLHGASYGSHLGLAVLRLHGERVGKAILCIVEGPDDTHKLPANTDRHFRHIAELARGSTSLDGMCPDLDGELRAVLEDYDAHPPLVQIAGMEDRVPLGRFAVQTVLGGALGSTRAIRGLPALARQLTRRDTSTLSRRFGRWLGQAPHGMMLAMDCASGATAQRMADIESQRKGALLDDTFNLPFPFVGDVMGVTDLGDTFRAPVRSATPTLFCCGTLDGRTPISNAVAARAGFSDSRLIVVEGASHEVPSVLIEPHLKFLRGEDVGDMRLQIPFEFDPL